jgi:hypothetical protein
MTAPLFTKMDVSGSSYAVNRKVQFDKIRNFKPTTVFSVFQFAYDMTFGAKGEHRHSRSGGSHFRNNMEIFSNTFQGKLSEFAVANLFFKHKDFRAPDLSTHLLGVWEDVDFLIGESVIAVKSTKSYGNLLLLEKKDWDFQGSYLASTGTPRIYTHLVLVRINPDSDEITRQFRTDHSDNDLENSLKSKITNSEWSYDIPGFIETQDLQRVIREGSIIPKGARLNDSVTMDADNYYVQAGDLRNIKFLKIQ